MFLTTRLVTQSVFLSLLALCAATEVFAQTLESIPANIFGDGNPANGIEDSRERVFGGPLGNSSRTGHHVYAGTIKCDGKTRGTAMVVDTRELVSELKSVVLVTAAHILYDLEKKQRFKRCEFQFMGLSEIPGYQAKIDLKNIQSGRFSPCAAIDGDGFGEGDWVFLSVPRPWKKHDPDESILLRDFSFVQLESFQQTRGELRLVAFNTTAGVIDVSRDCVALESRSDDLGGGAWPGQLLDDCDSVGGASGGGIVAVLNKQQYLIGIRTGSHWSEAVFPATEFPLGPPDGSVWDRYTNTNFGRAIDHKILIALEQFVFELKKDKRRF